MAIAFWYVTVGLIVLAVAVGIAAWFLFRTHSTSPHIPVANSQRLTRLASYRRAINRATALLTVGSIVLGAVLVTTAVAGGRWIYQQIETPEKYNRDIVLCLDISGSMIEYDVEVIDRYLDMLPGFDGERMGLMLWDSTAAEVFPLTDDYSFVEEQLTLVRDQMDTETGSYWYGTQNAP
ncbi:MAG: vWA domain-containing protein, partial [Pseudoclavibacter sp.]